MSLKHLSHLLTVVIIRSAVHWPDVVQSNVDGCDSVGVEKIERAVSFRICLFERELWIIDHEPKNGTRERVSLGIRCIDW